MKKQYNIVQVRLSKPAKKLVELAAVQRNLSIPFAADLLIKTGAERLKVK